MSLHAMYTRDEASIDADNLWMEAEEAMGRDLTDLEVAAYAMWEGWEPVTECSLCERKLKDTDPSPLCATCRATCVAHARLEQHRREWEADGSPR